MGVRIREPSNRDGAIWGRLIGSNQATLVPEVAVSILELEFPPEDIARMHELSSKAKQAPLTAEEAVTARQPTRRTDAHTAAGAAQALRRPFSRGNGARKIT